MHVNPACPAPAWEFAALHRRYCDVAICQLDIDPLKDTIIELWNFGYRHLVLQDCGGA